MTCTGNTPHSTLHPANSELVQRTYWLTREDVAALECMKGQALVESQLRNVDLSAFMRALIRQMRHHQQAHSPEWQAFTTEVPAALNPHKRGRTKEVTR